MRPDSPSAETMMRLFADPPPEYGLYPNWWWEGGAVTKEKLTWQAEQMKRAGSFGTFFYLRYVEDEPFAISAAYGAGYHVYARLHPDPAHPGPKRAAGPRSRHQARRRLRLHR